MAHTINTKLITAGNAAAKPIRALAKVRRFAVKCLEIIVLWQDRVQQRQALSELNDRMLKDIGVSNVDAYREAQKPFWLP